MGVSEFNPDLADLSQYTPIKELKPFKFYNIMGVLVDFNSNFKPGQECSFSLKDSTSRIEICYYTNDKKILCPVFSQDYQVIVVHNIQFIVEENGSLFGELNRSCSYKILTPRDIVEYSEIADLINNVKNAHISNSATSHENSESHQAAKRVKYSESIEPIQHATASTSQSQPLLENGRIFSNRNALNKISRNLGPPLLSLPKKLLNGIEPGNSYQIIVHVLYKEKSFGNRDEYVATDYSLGGHLNYNSIVLPNSKVLQDYCCANLTVWEDQRANISANKIYHLSSAVSKIYKNNKLELNIRGSSHTRNPNITIPLSIDQDKCKGVKLRLGMVQRGEVYAHVNPPSSGEDNSVSQFCLIKYLKVGEHVDMALLILRKIDNINSDNLTLFCTDFTSNLILKNSPSINYNKITVGSNMIIQLVISGNARVAINEVFISNPYNLIFQFFNLKVEASTKYGIKLFLDSNTAVKVINNRAELTFNPITKKGSNCYKKLNRRYAELSIQFSRETLVQTASSKRQLIEENSDA